MSTVTRERLAEIKARYTAASDKPWSYDPEDGWIESDGEHGGGIAMMHPHGNINTVLRHNETFSKADAEFITHARTDVPDLVETLEWYIGVAEGYGESLARLAKDSREDSHALSNLLARIHRDGGQYEAKHGRAKAVKDADEIVAALYAGEEGKE